MASIDKCPRCSQEKELVPMCCGHRTCEDCIKTTLYIQKGVDFVNPRITCFVCKNHQYGIPVGCFYCLKIINGPCSDCYYSNKPCPVTNDVFSRFFHRHCIGKPTVGL